MITNMSGIVVFTSWILSHVITGSKSEDCKAIFAPPGPLGCLDTSLNPFVRDDVLREMLQLRSPYTPCPRNCKCAIDNHDYISLCESPYYNVTMKEMLSEKTTVAILAFTDMFIAPGILLKNLLCLRLKNNFNLNNISVGFFHGLQKLVKLVIRHNSIEVIDPDAFIGLDSLKYLDLRSNNIRNLPNTVFSALGYLQSLDLSYNRIQTLSSNIFQSLNDLKYLDISNNDIASLSDDTFVANTHLEFLNLSVNQIASLPDQGFVGMNNLQCLDLSSNRLYSLPDQVFSSLISLEHLVLKRNELSGVLNIRAFNNLTQLTLLDISFNKIQFCYYNRDDPVSITTIINTPSADQAFVHLPVLYLPNLTTLIISYNMDVVDMWLFFIVSFPNLERLFMDVITIRAFDSCIFENFQNLKLLSLKKSKIEFLYDSFLTMHNLVKLEELDISSVTKSIPANRIFDGLEYSIYGSSTVEMCQNLTEVRSFNFTKPYVTIERGFSKPALNVKSIISTLIQKLTLNELEISNLDSVEFDPLIHLKSLHLSGNKIASVNFSFLPSRLWTQLNEIDLSSNPFSCDCNIMWFRNWINTTNVTLLNIDIPLAYTCMYPQEMKGIHIRNITNMNHCYSAPSNFLLPGLCLSLITFFILSLIASLIHKFRWHVQYWKLQIKNQTRQRRDLIDQREYTYDAFVMYSSLNSDWIKNYLLPHLENDTEECLHLCVHERDWVVGAIIFENIVQSIESSRKCLMIVSNAFITSNWCNYEMNLIQSRTITEDCSNTILILLEEIAPINMTPRLSLQMQRQTYIEWTEDEVGQGLFWTRLRQALKQPQQSLVHELPRRSEVIALR